MNNKINVITICTSYKFIPDMLKVYQKLSDMKFLVFLPAFLGKELTKEEYMELHRRKIDMSDAIYVVNPGGYIGVSVKEEIAYAKLKNKRIIYME